MKPLNKLISKLDQMSKVNQFQEDFNMCLKESVLIKIALTEHISFLNARIPEEWEYINKQAKKRCLIFYEDTNDIEIKEMEQMLIKCNFKVKVQELTKVRSDLNEENDHWNKETDGTLALLFHFKALTDNERNLIKKNIINVLQEDNLKNIRKCIFLNNPIGFNIDTVSNVPPQTLLAFPKTTKQSGPDSGMLIKIVRSYSQKNEGTNLWDILDYINDKEFHQNTNIISTIQNMEPNSCDVKACSNPSKNKRPQEEITKWFSSKVSTFWPNTKDDGEASLHDYTKEKGYCIMTDGSFSGSNIKEHTYFLKPNATEICKKTLSSAITGVAVAAWSQDHSAHCQVSDGGISHDFIHLKMCAGKYYTKIVVKIAS